MVFKDEITKVIQVEKRRPKTHLTKEEPTKEKEQLLKPEKMNDSSVPKAK